MRERERERERRRKRGDVTWRGETPVPRRREQDPGGFPRGVAWHVRTTAAIKPNV